MKIPIISLPFRRASSIGSFLVTSSPPCSGLLDTSIRDCWRKVGAGYLRSRLLEKDRRRVAKADCVNNTEIPRHDERHDNTECQDTMKGTIIPRPDEELSRLRFPYSFLARLTASKTTTKTFLCSPDCFHSSNE
eukprot:scaffold6223_cov57-Cylindrotheca_fusiformis.AAC.2